MAIRKWAWVPRPCRCAAPAASVRQLTRRPSLCFLPGDKVRVPSKSEGTRGSLCVGTVGTSRLGGLHVPCVRGGVFYTSSQAPAGPHRIVSQAPTSPCHFRRLWVWEVEATVPLALWGRRPCAGSGQPRVGDPAPPGDGDFVPVIQRSLSLLVPSLPVVASGPGVYLVFKPWLTVLVVSRVVSGPGLGSRLGVMALGAGRGASEPCGPLPP